MEPIKMQVKKVPNSSGLISLAPVKDTKINDKLTLKKDVVFFSVSALILSKMKKPLAVLVSVKNNLLYINPIFVEIEI